MLPNCFFSFFPARSAPSVLSFFFQGLTHPLANGEWWWLGLTSFHSGGHRPTALEFLVPELITRPRCLSSKLTANRNQRPMPPTGTSDRVAYGIQ
jgi:hypothetical protein